MVRLGTEVAEDVEVGAMVQYTANDGYDYRKYGAYGIVSFPMDDIVPYVGAQAQIGEGEWDVDSTIEPIAGIRVGNAFVECQYETIDDEDYRLMAGFRFPF
jgi:hypothetical protein